MVELIAGWTSLNQICSQPGILGKDDRSPKEVSPICFAVCDQQQQKSLDRRSDEMECGTNCSTVMGRLHKPQDMSPSRRCIKERIISQKISLSSGARQFLLLFPLADSDCPIRKVNTERELSMKRQRLEPSSDASMKRIGAGLRQTLHQLHFLVRATWEVFQPVCEPEELEEISSAEFTLVENEVIEEHFSDFENCEVIDSEFYPVEGSLCVSVQGWKHLRVQLPFIPTTKAFPNQLQRVVDVALGQISQLVNSEVDLDSEDHDIWLMEKGKAVLNLSHLLKYRERRLSYSEYRLAVHHSLQDLKSLP